MCWNILYITLGEMLCKLFSFQARKELVSPLRFTINLRMISHYFLLEKLNFKEIVDLFLKKKLVKIIFVVAWNHRSLFKPSSHIQYSVQKSKLKHLSGWLSISHFYSSAEASSLGNWFHWQTAHVTGTFFIKFN